MRTALPGARWLLGAVLLSAFLTFFWVCGVFTGPAVSGTPEASYGAALFFSATLAYVIPVFGYICERTRAAIEALRGVLDADDQQIDRWRDRVRRKPVAWLASVLALGSTSGIAHNLLLYDALASLGERGLGSAPELAVVIGTEAIWIAVTLVVAGLLDNALVLRRAAARCRVPLLETGRLRPFATVAVISTLALIGVLAAFPIMNLDRDLDRIAYIPGLLAISIPMLLMAVLPLWPVHRRIATAKHRALGEVNAQIASLASPDPRAPATLEALAPLLTYRRELLAIPEWPFDIGVVTRLGLYLIIPPLTWVGAALIENVVEALL